jgi:hypothetical protein
LRLGRAASAELIRAIVTAALTEQPGRQISLRNGDRTMGDSSPLAEPRQAADARRDSAQQRPELAHPTARSQIAGVSRE